MFKKSLQRWISILLSLALIFQMVPAQAFANEAESIAGEKMALLQADPRLAETEPGAASIEVANDNPEIAEIVAEIPEGRDEFQKEFLLSNGLRMFSIYGNAVHYKEDGEWKEIDNTLQPVSSTGALLTGKAALNTAVAYTNTAGIWNVTLPTGLNSNSPVSVSRDGYSLSFRFTGELHNNHMVMSTGNDVALTALAGNAAVGAPSLSDDFAAIQIGEITTPLQTSSAQLIAAHEPVDYSNSFYEETILEKLNTALVYKNIYANTDLRYDLTSHTLKESVIINSPSDTLAGYSYFLSTEGLVLELQDDNSILAYAVDAEAGDAPIFTMPAPYLVDAAYAYSADISVSLVGGNGSYTLTYRLPRQWMADDRRVYPVTLDPVVNAISSPDDIEDQSVFQYDQFGYGWEFLEAGYDPDYGNERIFIKFNALPELSSADVIVSATLQLHKVYSTSSVVMEAHEVQGNWASSSINWSNMPATNEKVEDYQNVGPSGWYSWDITNVAQKWYTNNTGIMLRMSDDVEDGPSANYHKFRSSDAYTNLPAVYITYLNNCGLEDYWDYTSQSAGRAGTGYVNNFTGNLVWINNGLSFSGTRMPVSISHVYNANDKDSNIFGLGFGWRTNYNQLVYQWTSNDEYYIWEDQDGTRRYFKYSSSGTYKNEIDNTLVLTTTGSGTEKYCITDKDNNKSYFDSNGRLTKISSYNQNAGSINITYSGSTNRIVSITDGVGRLYSFDYNTSNLLSSIKFKGTGSNDISTMHYTYDDSCDLTVITYPGNNSVSYSYIPSHLLRVATDVAKYAIHYSYTDFAPYRVASISESDIDANGNIVAGGSLSIEYSHNQTTFVDHNGNKEIMQFNNFGSTVSIQDGLGRAQFAQYASNSDIKSASQLSLSSKLQNTVVNLACNSGFEWDAFWTGASGNASTGSWGYERSTSYWEWYSLRITRTADNTAYSVKSIPSASVTVEPGKPYTLSAWIKTTGMDGGGNGAMIGLQLNSTGAMVAVSEAKLTNTNWTRVEVTYVHPANAATDTVSIYLMNQSVGNAYFDAVQLEQAPSASRLNLLENADFRRDGTYDTTGSDAFGWRYGTDITTSDERESVSDGSAASHLDSNAYKMVGSPYSQKRLYQNILTAGSAGDVFTLAGWAKGDGVPMPAGSDRRFGLVLRFYYSDGTEDDTLISFNPDCDSATNWQFIAGRAVAKKAFTSVRVLLVYEYNENDAYFDGIQLIKEEFGQSYTYDDNGNVVSVIDLQKQQTTYEYADNQLTKAVLPNGEIEEYTYYQDASGKNTPLVKTATTKTGVVSSFKYNEYGNNTEVTITSDGKSLTSSAKYTTNGNYLEKVTDPLGQTTTYSYNPDTGVLEWVRAPGETESTQTEYSYDSLYRTTGVDKVNASVSYSYATDLLSTINSAIGTAYSFTYGVFDLLKTVKIDSRTLISHEYSNDANRYLTKSTYGNNDYITYAYDAYGRTTSKTYEDGDTVSYGYDSNGNLGLMTDSATGRTTKYSYDFQNRLSRYEELGSGYSSSVKWSYNTDNELTSQTHILNGTEYVTNYTYDDDHQLTKTQQGNIIGQYTYDKFGRMTNVVSKNGDTPVISTAIGFTNPTDTTTSSQVYSWVNSVGGSYTYAYDVRGNITKIYSSGTLVAEFTYDSLDQLTIEKNYTANKRWEYTYDNGGNIKSKTEFSSVSATSGTTKSYTYGDSAWEDLLTKYNGQTLSYDGIGNLTGDGTWSYTWEHGRQLVGMSKSGTNISYAYNADGMRISKNVNGTVYNYHYLGDQLVEMTWGSNKMAFVYDVIGPAALIYNGTTYYYLRNAQGDVTGIVNTSGDKVADYHYDAWGNPQTVSGAVTSTVGNLNPLRYRGYVYDTETGLYYLQSRYYNPNWGRFICSDQHPSTGQGLTASNMFAYCGNNPVARKDENGEAFETVFDIISLGSSIADVIVNPANPWAWAGLVGDIADVAIPFVGGIGETVKLCGTIDKASDIVNAAKTVKKQVSSSVGTYEILYKSGKNYVGKGTFSRAIQSAQRYTKPHKLNDMLGDEILSITWAKADNNAHAFVTEYLWQRRKNGVLSANPKAKTYNQIWSPGKRLLSWE